LSQQPTGRGSLNSAGNDAGKRSRLSPCPTTAAKGHEGHHHYIDLGLVADIEGPTVRLSAVAATAVTFEEEKSGKPA